MDELFTIPEAEPDRLTRARLQLERAEAQLSEAEADDEAFDGFGVKQSLRDAVAAARYELQQAETERLRK